MSVQLQKQPRRSLFLSSLAQVQEEGCFHEIKRKSLKKPIFKSKNSKMFSNAQKLE